MAQRRHHYEQAFEVYLRRCRIPYVAVNEAKKALLPEKSSRAPLQVFDPQDQTPRSLKSFDFVIYGPSTNLLLEIKGRKIPRRLSPASIPPQADHLMSSPHSDGANGGRGGGGGGGKGRLESWVTEDDVESLGIWEDLFGQGFQAAFAFIYWCDEQPPDALFQETFEHQNRWYAIRAITRRAYASAMKPRSKRWRTVHLPTESFERLSQPLAVCGLTHCEDEPQPVAIPQY